MAITYVANFTRRAFCQNCGISVGLIPTPPTYSTRHDSAQYGATPCYATSAAIHALRPLETTIQWECPCCDSKNIGSNDIA